MLPIVFRCFPLIAMVAVSGFAPAAEMTASGISMPFFNEAGVLTHRLIAKTGAIAGSIQQLQGVELQYFSPRNAGVIVQKLEAKEATWDESKETLVGHGPIAVTTLENRLTGEGFDFSVATSLLHIHRDFTMTNAEAVLTSDRATIELVVEKSGEELKVRDVKRCEAIDNLHIVIQPAAQKKYRFTEAFSDLAVYDGQSKVVTLPHPTRTKKLDGGEGRFNTFTFTIGDQGKNDPTGSHRVTRP